MIIDYEWAATYWVNSAALASILSSDSQVVFYLTWIWISSETLTLGRYSGIIASVFRALPSRQKKASELASLLSPPTVWICYTIQFGGKLGVCLLQRLFSDLSYGIAESVWQKTSLSLIRIKSQSPYSCMPGANDRLNCFESGSLSKYAYGLTSNSALWLNHSLVGRSVLPSAIGLRFEYFQKFWDYFGASNLLNFIISKNGSGRLLINSTIWTSHLQSSLSISSFVSKFTLSCLWFHSSNILIVVNFWVVNASKNSHDCHISGSFVNFRNIS